MAFLLFQFRLLINQLIFQTIIDLKNQVIYAIEIFYLTSHQAYNLLEIKVEYMVFAFELHVLLPISLKRKLFFD